MLEHLNTKPRRPSRVVVVGAAGFVGSAVAMRLEHEGVPVLKITRCDVDLTAPNGATVLQALLRPGDSFVVAAARVPCKNAAMLVENVLVMRSMTSALATVDVAHVVNVSSDAVYADLPQALSETSSTAPGTLHGAMHLLRELLFHTEIKAPLATLRPSLLYGAADPHNGYGPNRFRRQAACGEDIVLFGEGEERRDHVYIDDLAELVLRVLCRRSTGILNVATGSVETFRGIAEKVSALSSRRVAIHCTPRTGPMPHNGYRAFDISACRAAFPDFRYTVLDDGLAQTQREMAGSR